MADVIELREWITCRLCGERVATGEFDAHVIEHRKVLDSAKRQKEHAAEASRHPDRQYLGDGLYADYDGYQISLFAHNGYCETDTVYLEPAVLTQFENYVARLRGRLYVQEASLLAELLAALKLANKETQLYDGHPGRWAELIEKAEAADAQTP